MISSTKLQLMFFIIILLIIRIAYAYGIHNTSQSTSLNTSNIKQNPGLNSSSNSTTVPTKQFSTICPNNIQVNWWSVPPYINGTDDGRNVNGVLKNIVEKMIRWCCASDAVQFVYLKAQDNHAECESKIGRNGALLNYPIYGRIATATHNGKAYFPIIESPGILYLKPTLQRGHTANLVLDSVMKGMPIIFMAMGMAAVFGVIIWMVDSHKNPDEFPVSFYKGAWHGFWWAMVTMTTVGYGDKAPRSNGARVVAFFWILVGIVIYGLFNSTISATLTANSLTSNSHTIYGKNLTALNKSQEERLGIQANAKMFPVRSIEDFIWKIKKGNVDGGAAGGLIDSYVAGNAENILKSSGLEIGEVFDEYPFTYGLVVSNRLDTIDFAKCLRKNFSNAHDFIIKLIHKELVALTMEKEDISSNVFDQKSPLFKLTFNVCMMLLGPLLFAGAVYQLVYKRKSFLKYEVDIDPELKYEDITTYACYDDMMKEQIAELEKAMVEEVVNYLIAFKKRQKDFDVLMTNPEVLELFRSGILVGDETMHFVKYN